MKTRTIFQAVAGLSLGTLLTMALVGCHNPTSASSNSSPSTSQSVANPNLGTLPDLPRWGVQVQSINSLADTQTPVFEEKFIITNNDIAPRDLSEILLRVYFNAPQGSIAPVNSTFATVFNPNGGVTGTNSTVTISQFVAFVTQCTNPEGITTNQDWDFSFQSGTMVPPSGFVTFIPTLQRAGGAFPFNNTAGNFTTVNGNQQVHNDPNIGIFFNSLGLNTEACNFLTPLITVPTDDPCTGAPIQNCATQVP